MALNLTFALGMLKKGDMSYLILEPLSYHQIIFEIHRLLLDMVSKKSIYVYGAPFVGWEKKTQIPLELKEIARLFKGAEALYLKTGQGWDVYVAPGGGARIHLNILRMRGKKLTLVVSDFLPSRDEAVTDILTEHGLKLQSSHTINMENRLKDGSIEKYSNYIRTFVGKVSDLGLVVQVLFRSQHLFWLRLNLPPEDARRKEALLIRTILETYLKRPNLPAVPWGDIIYNSDLRDILGQLSNNETVNLITRLLALPLPQLKERARKGYHLNY